MWILVPVFNITPHDMVINPVGSFIGPFKNFYEVTDWLEKSGYVIDPKQKFYGDNVYINPQKPSSLFIIKSLSTITNPAI